MKRKFTAAFLAAIIALNLASCGGKSGTVDTGTSSQAAASEAADETSEFSNSDSDGHAINADGEAQSYDHITVTKTGDSAQNDEADFYGTNAAVIAQNGGTLTISNADISTDGSHANAVFAYGEGSTVNISDSTIHTTSNNSGGIMTTGGAVMNAENLNVVTEGGSSAAIRSDRGGGTVTVEGGYYEANGSGSPAIYSTADITVNDAELVSNAAQGVVVEGKNSVTLNNDKVTADNTVQNSDKSTTYQAVMLYQSMSGDADSGEASFTMTDGSLTSKNGGMFFVTNTNASITLEEVDMTYATDDLLRIEKAGWGNEGSNGGNVTFTNSKQKLEGLITVDDISTLNLYLTDGSTYSGAINTDGAAGSVYVELSDDSTWTLTADSYITSLTCDADSINLNGHKLYVNGTEYEDGTSSSGEKVDAYISDTKDTQPDNGGTPSGQPDGNGTAPSGKPGESSSSSGNPDGGSAQNGSAPSGKPDGNGPAPEGSKPPEKPDGNSAPPSGNPPAKPGESESSSAAS